VNCPDVTGPPATGYATGEVNTGAPVHSESVGPYSLKVIVAPASGLTRPATVAASDIGDPIVAEGDACVVIVGVATTRCDRPTPA
jgi:hypothetical protein